ncbi:glycosyltransferase [Candidatus Microgenomates bacterium]|nr:glycosyltransferase [Candidatus Microgenomates bacterium]
MRKRRETLNEENSLLVITNYHDDTREIKHLDPVAIHAKRILTQLSKSQKILVLAEKTGRKKTHVVNKQLTVLRIWEKKNPASFPIILSYVAKYNKIRMIHIQFDFNTFGGTIPSMFLPLLIAALKLMGKHVSIELHHVPFDITTIKRHHRNKAPIFLNAMNHALLYFYKALGVLCDKVIVFEEDLRERLMTAIPEEKLIVLPMGVHEQQAQNKSAAKRRLGLKSDQFVLMSFGFFDWHKGTDWIAKTIQELKIPKVNLLLVGGQNPSLKYTANYRQFYRDIMKLSMQAKKNIKVVGFVTDKHMSMYYSAADLIVFPYREFLSAPTAVTHALSFGKPIVFSNNLTDYTKSPDFAHAMDMAGLTTKDLFFPLHKTEFEAFITHIKHNKDIYKKLVKFSQILAGERKSTRVLRDYQTIISKRYAMRPRFMFRFR